ncbi:MAG: preprotein translocase subunit YajC [Dysgonamonadaceae bacterium]|jgi:preprotein translocase subunit YajC|nr:preprotein translocase subunit YajC [Dysgonamonadaceae bacterium]MDD3308696.1 preprotein translocase subunit YajC [Dysgonamonadaceae bacterium]MDD3901081.1 preprotein translocase subunit YajC [Dysgonamonadaceae bacterium]MDD4399622.1 preprotein translocase subunit YajC [Dysgonamonadaceae bacterium]MEA5080254.1 preprotein translocase subunit YajC [Dysgonamonadaceae bacterium]
MDILLQAATGSQNGLGASLLMMVAIIAIFYFFMIRPQQKKQKEIEKTRNAMTVGDKVVTAGGIHGRIREVGDTYFVIEIADNVKIKVEKGSVYAAAKND